VKIHKLIPFMDLYVLKKYARALINGNIRPKRHGMSHAVEDIQKVNVNKGEANEIQSKSYKQDRSS
jgi:hypothetical protein